MASPRVGDDALLIRMIERVLPMVDCLIFGSYVLKSRIYRGGTQIVFSICRCVIIGTHGPQLSFYIHITLHP